MLVAIGIALVVIVIVVVAVVLLSLTCFTYVCSVVCCVVVVDEGAGRAKDFRVPRALSSDLASRQEELLEGEEGRIGGGGGGGG